jgi:hypothetical protein
MAMAPFADPANSVAMEIEDGPEGDTSLQLLQAIYKNRKQPLNVRVRRAIEALAHEYPKVSAVQVSHMNGQDFASALERAIMRSKSPLPLPAPTMEHDQASLRRPMRDIAGSDGALAESGVTNVVGRLWISCAFLVLNNKDGMSFILLKSDFF